MRSNSHAAGFNEKSRRGGGSTWQCFSRAVIKRFWSYGGLRSSPLSRNRELMQRIAGTGYLKPGVICKCRGRLAPRNEEENGGSPPSSSPSLALSRLASAGSASSRKRRRRRRRRRRERRKRSRCNLHNALSYVFLLLFSTFSFPRCISVVRTDSSDR